MYSLNCKDFGASFFKLNRVIHILAGERHVKTLLTGLGTHNLGLLILLSDKDYLRSVIEILINK